MIRLVVLVLTCLFLCGVHVVAQVEVYSNASNKLDSLILFGATRPSPPVGVYRTIWVRNTSSVDIGIKPSITDTKGQLTDVVNEFAGLFGNEIVPAGQTKQFTVVYKADYKAFPEDSLALVRFNIDVEEASSQRFVFRRSFVLSGLKSRRLLATDMKTISFDSVFVNPSCTARSAVTIYSIFDTTVVVREQRIQRVTPYLGVDELAVATYPTVEFPGISNLSWNCTYQPVNAGFDAIDFRLLYTNASNSGDTSVDIRMQGIGVTHKLAPILARAIDGSGVEGRISGDTVYVGEVPDSHDSVNLAFLVQNQGSIAIGIDSVALVRGQQAKGRFRLTRSLGQSLQAGSSDTVRMIFVPEDFRLHAVATIRVYTNLGRRAISCVPQSARVRDIVIIARNRPNVRASVDSVPFGVIVKPVGCEAVRTRRISIRHNGSASSIIDSVSINPLGGSVSISRTNGTVIPAKSTVLLDVVCNPTLIGSESGVITIWLGNGQGAITLPYSVSTIAPDTVRISVEGDVRSAPGAKILLPVIIGSSSMTNIQRITLDVDVDPMLLAYAGTIESGTAAQGALIRQVPREQGFRLTIDRDEGLADRDTLIVIQFDAFLGDTIATPIVLSGFTSVGTATCPSAFPLMVTHGRYSTDSLCGLSYKTRGARAMLRGSVFPNPTSAFASLVVASVRTTPAKIWVTNTFGRMCVEFATVINEGLTLVPMDASELPAGQYLVVIEQDGFITRVPWMVAQ